MVKIYRQTSGKIMNEKEYCPKCLLGKKVEKSGKYGEFISCTRFPYCDYIEKIQESKDDLEKQADEILKQNSKTELII